MWEWGDQTSSQYIIWSLNLSHSYKSPIRENPLGQGLHTCSSPIKVSHCWPKVIGLTRWEEWCCSCLTSTLLEGWDRDIGEVKREGDRGEERDKGEGERVVWMRVPVPPGLGRNWLWNKRFRWPLDTHGDCIRWSRRRPVPPPAPHWVPQSLLLARVLGLLNH